MELSNCFYLFCVLSGIYIFNLILPLNCHIIEPRIIDVNNQEERSNEDVEKKIDDIYWSGLHLEALGQLMSSSIKTLANEELGITLMKRLVEQASGQKNQNAKDSSKTLEHVFINYNPEESHFHHFVYHRLDLIPVSASQPKLCRYLKQMATLESATLFLPSSSFALTTSYLNQQEETPQMIQRYMVYFNDKTKLIANPGFKSGVRDEIHFLSKILPFWKTKIDTSLSKSIVRKFIASTYTMFIYPGAVVDKNFEPAKRDWFGRAVERSGNNELVITGPYIDGGGAGFIVTLSYAIFHSNNESIVMGMDMALGYFQKFLLEVMPICSNKPMSCFLMEDRGYLLAHPLLVEPTGRGPLEQQHITHKEPLVANDLLNHKDFVSKKVCNSFSDRTIQRFYTFNTSLGGTVTNNVNGQQCAKYQIVSLPETNLFMGVVNQTCESVTAFCPCSMTDRLCLNCHRLEQTDCECPCECPLEINFNELNQVNDNPTCPSIGEVVCTPPTERVILDSLPSCFDINCFNRQTDTECLGVLGCEWCQLDSSGINRLAKPFCHYQNRCFGGLLGSATPYGDQLIEGLSSDDYPNFGSTPVGPVAGAIMICFVALALSVYCYRNHSSRQANHFITLADPNLRHVHFNNDFEGGQHEELTPAPLQANAVVLASFENAAGVSPYRINPVYRRPGGDSDHGYSTMTPHEADSELAGPAFNEPLLIARDKQRLQNKQTNTTEDEEKVIEELPTKSSPVPPMTVLSSSTDVPCSSAKLPLLAQVQVHVVDANG